MQNDAGGSNSLAVLQFRQTGLELFIGLERDFRAVDFELLELLEVAEMSQAGVGDRRAGKVQHFEITQIGDCGQSSVADREVRQVELFELFEAGNQRQRRV